MSTITTLQKIQRELLHVRIELFKILADTAEMEGTKRTGRILTPKRHDDLNRAIGRLTDLEVKISQAVQTQGRG